MVLNESVFAECLGCEKLKNVSFSSSLYIFVAACQTVEQQMLCITFE